MNEPRDIIICILFIAFLVFLIALMLIEFFHPGKKREILIVKKRTTVHKGYSNIFFREFESNHHTVDCRYTGSEKLRTLNCEQDVFNRLKEGKRYTVTVKLMRIKNFMSRGI